MFFRRNSNLKFVDIPEKRLINLMIAVQEIEELLGYDDLDVEFAVDNDENVYILQVRPIAVKRKKLLIEDKKYDLAFSRAHNNWAANLTPPPHLPPVSNPLYGVMPDWNPAEIIGTSPSVPFS